MPIVQSLPVQRLRNISQNARTIAAYPSQNGSRFEHALGTMHLASLAWEYAFLNTREPEKDSQVKEAFLREVADFLEEASRDQSIKDTYLQEKLRPSSDRRIQESRRKDLIEDLPRMISHAVGIVGLLHDVGHPPFSHLLESIFKDNADHLFGPGTTEKFQKYQAETAKGVPQFHEYAGKLILAELRKQPIFENVSIALVEKIFGARSGGGWDQCLHSIIDGQMDVDRLDYIRRDAMRAGTEYHAIDQERLLESIELHHASNGDWLIGVSARGVSAVETLLLQRAQSYRWVIHNSRAIVSDTCLHQAFAIAINGSINSDPIFADQPQLNYATQWQSESFQVPLSYQVDDSAVRTWLRACRTRASRSRDPLHTKFLAVMSIADESSANYRSAWRTYGDFYLAVEAYLKKGDSEDLADLIPAKSKNEETAEKTDETKEQNGEDTASAVLDAIDLDANCLALNALLRELEKHPIGAAKLIEDHLNDRESTVDGEAGIWVVKYLPNFNAYDREKTKMWIDDDEYYLHQLSPIPAALAAAEQIRPALWPFFITFSSKIPERHFVADAVISAVVDLCKTAQITMKKE